MGAVKRLAVKKRLIALSKKKGATRWAEIKKFGRRARSRHIRVAETKHWRRGRLKV